MLIWCFLNFLRTIFIFFLNVHSSLALNASNLLRSIVMRVIIFINNPQHAAVIAPIVPFFHEPLLLLHDLIHGGLLILLLDDSLESRGNLLVVIVENFRFPKRSPNRVPCAVSVSPVDKFGPLVESHVVRPNVNVSILSQNVILNSVDFESSLTLPLREEENFVNFI